MKKLCLSFVTETFCVENGFAGFVEEKFQFLVI